MLIVEGYIRLMNCGGWQPPIESGVGPEVLLVVVAVAGMAVAALLMLYQ
jgi:hypothetical protein